MSERVVVGVDLGGTNVRACSYFKDGRQASEKFSRPSRAQESVEHVVGAISSVIADAAVGEIEAVGLAIPGHIDDTGGLVRWAPNFGQEIDGVFHSWRDVPLKRLLEGRVPYPIVTGNDANLAALGEYRFGAGRGTARCLVMITLGTGIGGGVVMSPAAVHGSAGGPLILVGGNGGGAELGHTCIDPGGPTCDAGTYGALEAYCQAEAIVTRAHNKLRRGGVSVVNELVRGDLSLVTPQVLSDAATQGDALALEVWEEVGSYLGVGLGNFINIFAPDILAVGGQITKVGEPLMAPARRAARNVAIPSLFQDTKIVQAEQLDDAGMLGAAALAMEMLNWSNKS